MLIGLRGWALSRFFFWVLEFFQLCKATLRKAVEVAIIMSVAFIVTFVLVTTFITKSCLPFLKKKTNKTFARTPLVNLDPVTLSIVRWWRTSGMVHGEWETSTFPHRSWQIGMYNNNNNNTLFKHCQIRDCRSRACTYIKIKLLLWFWKKKMTIIMWNSITK